MSKIINKKINVKTAPILLTILLVLLASSFMPATGIAAAAKGKDCKTLCASALKATGGKDKIKYKSSSALSFGALSASSAKKVKDIMYVCDSKEVYSICVMEAKSKKDAGKLLKDLKKYKKSNTTGNYYLSDYSKTEQKVLGSTLCGKKSKTVWYIAMSPDASVNKKGENAIKKSL